jgi:hypothetical protein
VVWAQTGFQFAVVVFDAPADLGQAHEFLQGCAGVEGGDPVVGGFFGAGRPLGEQPGLGKAAVVGCGDVAVRRADPQGQESGRIAAAGLSGSVLVPWRQVSVFRAGCPAATARSLQDWCGSR